jgi:DNA repair exonuclease SbcCD ATPase subunit
MSLFEEYDKLKSRAIALNGGIQASARRLSSMQEQLAGKETLLEEWKETFRVQMEAVEVLKNVVEKKSQDHLQQIKSLLSLALQTVFPDRKYGIEIEIDDKRGVNAASFFLIEQLADGSVVRSPVDGGTGGSIRAVIGFVLQVFYIHYFKLAKVIFLDEAFGSISETYVPTLMEFIKQLAVKKGFVFTLITHDPRVIPYVDRVYRISNGSAVLEVDKMKG